MLITSLCKSTKTASKMNFLKILFLFLEAAIALAEVHVENDPQQYTSHRSILKQCIRKCHKQFKPSNMPSKIREELADEENDPVRPRPTRHLSTRLPPSRIPRPTRHLPSRLPPSRIPSPTHQRPTFSPPSRKPSKFPKELADEESDPLRRSPSHHRPTRLPPSRIPSPTHHRPIRLPPSRIPSPTRHRPGHLPPSRTTRPTHQRPNFSPPSRKPSKIPKELADEENDRVRSSPTHHRPTRLPPSRMPSPTRHRPTFSPSLEECIDKCLKR